MNLISISWHYLKNNALNTALNILLLGLGIGLIVFLILVENQLSQKFENDLKGIKMVISAKGSPLQSILCNIYQIDNPTGNIPLKEFQELARSRFIKKTVPMSLGDNYEGFRIVGTNQDYLTHYEAKIAKGKTFEKVMEVAIGNRVAEETGLKIGDTFASSHGLLNDAEAITHDEHLFKVVGILEKNKNVSDRLILTGIPSFWVMHDIESESDSIPSFHAGDDLPDLFNMPAGEYEITSFLVLDFTNPMAVMQLPRKVNKTGSLQAAMPALEISLLLEKIGIGAQAVQVFAWILLIIAVLSTFIALYNALKTRRYDLAVMRSLGASRSKLFSQMILEGCILASLGVSFGLFLGHLAVEIAGNVENVADRFDITGFLFLQKELWLILLIFGVGLIASIIPAIQSYRVDVAETLSR